MSIPIYSIVAWSGTGKTTLIEKMIPIFKEKGLKVGVIKHDAHNFEMDKEGKDSWRMTQAGADVTVIASSTKAAILENRPVSWQSLISHTKDVDIIITEGYKHGDWPKILLHRSATQKPLALNPEECFAIVSDVNLSDNIPSFKLDDVKGITDFILADMK